MKSRKRRNILLALAALLAIGAGVAVAMWNKPHRTAENEAGLAVTAAELQAAYTRNEATANAKYLDKAVEVSGTVAAAEQNQDGKTVLYLDDPMTGVGCTMRDAAAATVKTGQAVRLKGFCSGTTGMGVAVRECVLLP